MMVFPEAAGMFAPISTLFGEDWALILSLSEAVQFCVHKELACGVIASLGQIRPSV